MTTPPLPAVDDTPQPAEPLTPESPHHELPAPADPSRLRRLGKRVGGPLLLVALLTGAMVAVGNAGKSEPAAAKVGDCVHDLGGGSKPNMELVDCTKPNADFKITKVTHDGSDPHPCESEPENVFGSYSEERQATIFTLCLSLNAGRPGGPAPLPNWPEDH
ncbi:hypothetical protein [Streptomyces sp. CBMA123]|uniref:LppU/SCO3897 family protein n=1 Tax=Streptomyces sp. CBMA123 TaxID=1896313 RepID=UPI001661A304|nr:hypothetical protein [Streptomyces sp. CBMA123]MBD0690713.1 hypothetical protein [Streptomyces sp. CBMA123]